MNKKLLLLALLLCSVSGTFASTLLQGNWRWRNNDGDENTATFKAAQNTSIEISDLSVIRLRIRVENTDATETHGVGALRYSTSQDGTFTLVGEGTNPVFVYDNTALAPAEKSPTTRSDFLTTTSGATSYLAGQYFSADRVLDKFNLLPATSSDLEFVIKPTVNIAPNTTYYFLIENESSSGTHNLATLTTAASVLPVNFLRFEAKPNNNSVRLNWSTASEKNNDRFEVSRSVDAKNWQLVGSEKGKGNSEVTSSYSLTDNRPLNGISYYQLAQFDHDGTKSILSTKSLNLSLGAAVEVQVFPNPVSKEINFSIANHIGKKVEASLYSQDGKLLHKEQFSNDNKGNRLNISSIPTAGIYVLKLKGQGLAVSKKIVIL